MTTAAPPAPPAPPGRPRRRRRSIGAAITGVVGELLITAGVLLGLYVVWNLWWTDIQADRLQNELQAEFIDTLVLSPDQEGSAQDGEPPLEVPPMEGDTFARIWVPTWGSDAAHPYVRTITEGVDRRTVLDTVGIGHYPDTQMPGEIGNFAIAGHRQTHGSPFYHIDTLQPGDEVIIETAEAWYVYRVTSDQIVNPSDGWVVSANPFDLGAAPTKSLLTITTCHPLYSTKYRWVVHGELEEWFPRESGKPTQLVGVDI